MRAPFQILAIPYKYVDNEPFYCVLHRSDVDYWQFISGGGEDDETPLEAAKREILEESCAVTESIIQLTSLCYIPTFIFPKKYLDNWDSNIDVVPEYTFAFECAGNIKLSLEHTECVWLSYDEAVAKLKWDSNRTALYELKCRLEAVLL